MTKEEELEYLEVLKEAQEDTFFNKILERFSSMPKPTQEQIDKMWKPQTVEEQDEFILHYDKGLILDGPHFTKEEWEQHKEELGYYERHPERRKKK